MSSPLVKILFQPTNELTKIELDNIIWKFIQNNYTKIRLNNNPSVIAQSVHQNIVPAVAQQSQLPMHPPQQPTPQPPGIPGQHVTQGPVMTMAYFVQQQQAFSGPPHAQQAIGKFSMKHIK